METVCAEVLWEMLYEARETSEPVSNIRLCRETITDMDFRSVELENVEFDHCRFIGCRCNGTVFYRTVFRTCDISNLLFRDSWWKESSLLQCKAEGADFGMSRLKDTVIEGTSLNFAEFSESTIENCRITDSRLRSCGFRQVQLRRTTLQDVSLSDADVHMTSFRGVDLSGCAIDGLRLSRDLSELQGAKISAPQAVDIAGIIGIQIL